MKRDKKISFWRSSGKKRFYKTERRVEDAIPVIRWGKPLVLFIFRMSESQAGKEIFSIPVGERAKLGKHPPEPSGAGMPKDTNTCSWLFKISSWHRFPFIKNQKNQTLQMSVAQISPEFHQNSSRFPYEVSIYKGCEWSNHKKIPLSFSYVWKHCKMYLLWNYSEEARSVCSSWTTLNQNRATLNFF